MKMEEEMKKINENFDSAIKVIEKNKELLREREILKDRISFLKNIIGEAIELMNENKQDKVLEVLRKSYIPTFEEVERLFKEQKQ